MDNFNYLIGMTRSTDEKVVVDSLTNFTIPTALRAYDSNELNQMNGDISEANDIFRFSFFEIHKTAKN